MMRSVSWRLLVVCILAGAPGMAHAEQAQVVHIKAHMFAYSPEEIVVKKGVPVTLDLMSIDQVRTPVVAATAFRLVESIRASARTTTRPSPR